jgi:hypothetical protein
MIARPAYEHIFKSPGVVLSDMFKRQKCNCMRSKMKLKLGSCPLLG